MTLTREEVEQRHHVHRQGLKLNDTRRDWPPSYAQILELVEERDSLKAVLCACVAALENLAPLVNCPDCSEPGDEPFRLCQECRIRARLRGEFAQVLRTARTAAGR